jgi:acyl-CoA synthetase (AMP-forming)/AMP-acid ligase II
MPDLELLNQLRAHAAARPDEIAYREASTNRTITWRELTNAADTMASALRPKLPARSVVMLCTPNVLEYPIAFFGIVAAGFDVFPVSSEIAEAELQRAIEQSGARAMIKVNSVLPLTPGEGRGDAQGASILEEPREGDRIAPHRNPLPGGEGTKHKPALLLLSSGTTGLPKIVRRSGESLDAVSAAMAESVGFTSGDHVLAAVPLSHSYGLEHGLLAPVWAGSTVHLCRGLDVPTVLGELAGNQITIFPAVPAMFELLANVSEAPPITSLRSAYSAGAPLPDTVIVRFADRFNVRVTQLYGATEIGSVTFNNPRDVPFEPASVGRPMRGVDIRILDPMSNAPLPSGASGHVAIRSAGMFDGYLNEPANLLDGFFATGDLGHVDPAGRLFITGRLKLLIDVGGMKVNPFEVETVLCQHPQVAECVVVPIRQSETVSRLKAVLTPRDPASPPSVESLRAFAKSHLTGYKVPRMFEVRDALPHTAAGKIMRQQIEAEANS